MEVSFLGLILNGSNIGIKIFMLRKWWWAPIFGLCQQAIYVTYALVTEKYEFLLTPVILSPIYAISVPKWYHERYEHEYVECHEVDYYHEERMKHPQWHIKNYIQRE
jgi:hypothetical protein